MEVAPLNAVRTDPDDLVRPYAPQAQQLVPVEEGSPQEGQPVGPLPVPPAGPGPDAAANPAPGGRRQGSRAADGPRSRRGLRLALLLAVATAAAVAVLVEVTGPSGGGVPARSLPAVGPAAPSAIPSAGPSSGSGVLVPAAGPVSAPATARAPAAAAAGSPSVRAHGPAAPTRSAAVPGALSRGDTGAAVTALQRLLFDQGFTYVSTTGVYDEATVRGVTQLQQNRGITGDPVGVYGPRTRAALQG